MILLVAYDLKGPAGSYNQLFEALKKQDGWAHYMKSTWLIASDKTPDQLVDELRPHLQSNDRILITALSKTRQGLLPDGAWEWIKKHKS